MDFLYCVAATFLMHDFEGGLPIIYARDECSLSVCHPERVVSSEDFDCFENIGVEVYEHQLHSFR